MNIGILGYGKEGQSAERYFTSKNHEVAVFDNFTTEDLAHINFDGLDLLLRSPSVHPLSADNPFRAISSSMTQYFFTHCPCPIIGVTGTKGKGTTCSLITDLFKSLDQKVWLVGNIGNPALDVLDEIQPSDIVVYEMSSFQLWDLETSPRIAVITTIEPDHLNVHNSYDDYISAKTNIARHQTSNDTCIYYSSNPDSTKIAKTSPGHKISYPIHNRTIIDDLLSHLAIPGRHNRNNAEAALLAVASYYILSIDNFIQQNHDTIIKTLENFRGLPHRLQFLRELNGIKYYDDNFSTTPTSLEVALQAFPNQKIILIAGGRDKTDNADLPEIAKLIQSPNVARTILIGESGHELHKLLRNTIPNRIATAENLSNAVEIAQAAAEGLSLMSDDDHFLPQAPPKPTSAAPTETIVLMSPAAASFDMFENVYARGAEFQKLINALK